jgi:hypothetical protein
MIRRVLEACGDLPVRTELASAVCNRAVGLLRGPTAADPTRRGWRPPRVSWVVPRLNLRQAPLYRLQLSAAADVMIELISRKSVSWSSAMPPLNECQSRLLAPAELAHARSLQTATASKEQENA